MPSRKDKKEMKRLTAAFGKLSTGVSLADEAPKKAGELVEDTDTTIDPCEAQKRAKKKKKNQRCNRRRNLKKARELAENIKAAQSLNLGYSSSDETTGHSSRIKPQSALATIYEHVALETEQAEEPYRADKEDNDELEEDVDKEMS